MQSGDKVFLIDGKGGFYEGQIHSMKPWSVNVKITRAHENYGKRDCYLHIAIAPTKNTERFEWFIEKSTEIGIEEITPLLCHRSERKSLRIDRLEKILISAMKQSQNAFMPILNRLTGFMNFIHECHDGNKYIAHCREDGKGIHLINTENINRHFTILIGPEGDFTDEEIMAAENKGFISVNLGRNRLRTETAGIVTCQVIADWHASRSG